MGTTRLAYSLSQFIRRERYPADALVAAELLTAHVTGHGVPFRN